MTSQLGSCESYTIEKRCSGRPMKRCWQKPVTAPQAPCIPQLRGSAPCCSLWSLLAPQQGSFPSGKLLCNDLKMGNDCLDNKHYKNQDIQVSLTVAYFFLLFSLMTRLHTRRIQQNSKEWSARIPESSIEPARLRQQQPPHPTLMLDGGMGGEHAAIEGPRMMFCFHFLLD